jgi:hypothetical protein
VVKDWGSEKREAMWPWCLSQGFQGSSTEGTHGHALTCTHLHTHTCAHTCTRKEIERDICYEDLVHIIMETQKAQALKSAIGETAELKESF